MKIFIANAALHPCNKGVEGLTKSLAQLIIQYIPKARIVIWHTPLEKMSPRFKYICLVENNIKVIYEYSYIKFLIKIVVYAFLLFFARIYKRLRLFLKDYICKSVHECNTSLLVPLCELLNADLILNVNYGDVFTDYYYGFTRFFTIAAISFLLNLVGKPIVYPPQSLGPFRTLVGRIIAQIILKNKNIKLIMVREAYSKHYLVSLLNGSSKNVIESLDLAFLLESNESLMELKELDFINSIADKTIIGFIIDPYRFIRNDSFRLLALKILLFLAMNKKSENVILLIPHSENPFIAYDGESINKLIEKVFKIHKHDNVIAIKSYPVEALKAIIKRCKLVISFPTHPAIFAISEGVIPIVISYSHKAKGILQFFGLEHLYIGYEPSCLNAEKIYNSVKKLYTQLQDENLAYLLENRLKTCIFKIKKKEKEKWFTICSWLFKLSKTK